MHTINPIYIRESLQRLARTNPRVFGANGHHFELNSALPESEVAAFERMHGVRLPDDYRTFITRIGNGGAGPYYGLFPLGYMDDGFKLASWDKGYNPVGDLASEFPYRESWNDLTGRPLHELAEEDEEEYERQLHEFEERYYAPSVMDGAFPICHMGCALRVWLVVTGEQRGRVWRDSRADDAGVSPMLLKDGSAATFSGWYMEWLEEALSLLNP